MAIINVTLKDTFDQWRVKCNEIAAGGGDLSLLQTTIKTSSVDAINELKLRTDEQGSLVDLDTDYKIDIVGSINEVHSDTNLLLSNVGDLVDLDTDYKIDLVGAINEVHGDFNLLSQDINTRVPYAHDSLQDLGNAGTSIIINTIDYDQCMFTRDANTLVLDASGLPVGRTFELIMTNAVVGTITWPVGTRWPGTIPEFGSTGTDRIRLQRVSSSVIHATLIGSDY